MELDQISQTAQELGSPNVMVITLEDFERVWAIIQRAGEEGFLTEDERFALELVERFAFTCPAAAVSE